jgi:TolB-like protein/Flp pilus assembly protein TadD
VQIEAVAVLPFRNLTGDAAQDYLADGLTDALITELQQLPGMQVTSRTTSMSLAGTKKSLKEIARELKVDALVEGSMTRVGGNIRVSVNLVDVRDRERSLWTERFEHGERDFAGLQDVLNRQVATQIHPGARPSRVARSPDPDAHIAYLKGRHLAGQGTEASIRQALDWYVQASALEPHMALAKSGQAHSYISLSDFFMSPAEALPLAKMAAAEAVRMDPLLADAYAAKGAAALFHDRDAQIAETNLLQALKLNPNSSEAHSMFAVLRGAMGRFDDAVASARRAVRLDPLSPTAYAWLQWILLVAERYQEVEQVGRAGLQLFPDAPLIQLWTGGSFAMRGDHHKAAPFFEKAAKFDQIPMMPLFLGLMRALDNDKSGAQALLAKAHKIGKHRYICAYEVATLHSALGEMDEAYRWMERGLEERCVCLTWLMTEPWMKSFRADPRFPALAEKVGLWNKVRSF